MSVSKANRAKVLDRIRDALGANAPDMRREVDVRHRLVTHPIGTIPARSLGNHEACLTLFHGMLASQGADVARVHEPEGVVKAIVTYLADLDAPTELRISEEPVLVTLPWLLAPRLKQVYGAPSPSDKVGVSRAIAGVAETGTLILVSGAGNPISLNFLPETHIVLVDAGDIVGSYEEAWDRLRALYGEGTLPRTVNWISGPSRTADIEQTIIRGAHGPKRLIVVILDERGP
ncbi:MAG TPA: LUD domain-containing protein [Methyloceanibacter sp.]